MLNIKLFKVQHSNDERQNDLSIKLFDVGHLNGECRNAVNVECQIV